MHNMNSKECSLLVENCEYLKERMILFLGYIFCILVLVNTEPKFKCLVPELEIEF
jgi:hypothetical protein